ncbi:MAG: glycosyltransferase family 2 protein [Bacteroidia bacterium]|nr:glycosyltransferase family 2 protein [Bacteroidia bacterium]
MTPLSVVIITFNEERNIARCLTSVGEIADDIVVVDSYSTDRTEAICHEHGARFVQHAFEGHIEQKNWAITQAIYPHILSLDADEALDATLIQSITEIKKNWHCDGYLMNRLTNYCGRWIRHCGWYPDTKLRLWDSRKGQWTGINPHDEYRLGENCSTGQLKGNILHYSYYTLAAHLKQIRYFTDISSGEAYKKGKRAYILHLAINPLVKFIKSYFFQLGILDGKAGFTISYYSSYATYLKYKKIRDLANKEID